MFNSTGNRGNQTFPITLRKGFVTALALVFLIIPMARSAPPDKNTMAMIDAAIASERKGYQRIRKLDTYQITSLLLNENFEELESTINSIEASAKKDPSLEFEFHAFFQSMDSTDSNLLAPLDKWVKSKPSAASYSARGTYLKLRAFHVRGTRFAKETPPLNFELMDMVASQSIQDLKKAIALDPSYIPAYTALIKISKISRKQEVDAFRLVSAISQRQPSNFLPRGAFLETLEPRWGGSHEAMLRYATNAAKDAKHNPMLWLLTGDVYLDMVRSRDPRNPEQDIKDLTEALKYGETNTLLEARGDTYWYQKNHDAAIEDYSKCASNNPGGPHNCKKSLDSLINWRESVKKFEQTKAQAKK